MNRFLLTAFCLGTACFLSTTAFSECVCGKKGCEPCDSMEDFFEDVSEKIHKDSKKIKKMIKHETIKEQVGDNCHPRLFFLDQAALLSESGEIIAYYEELTEDDTLSLTTEQKEKAKADAKTLVDTGKKINQNVAAQKENCPQAILFENDAVFQEMPVKKAEQKVHKMMPKSHGSKTEYIYDILEDNAGNIIAVGETLQEKTK